MDELISTTEAMANLFNSEDFKGLLNNDITKKIITEASTAALNIIGEGAKPEDLLNINLKFKFKENDKINEFSANLDFKNQNYNTVYKPDVGKKKPTPKPEDEE